MGKAGFNHTIHDKLEFRIHDTHSYIFKANHNNSNFVESRKSVASIPKPEK